MAKTRPVPDAKGQAEEKMGFLGSDRFGNVRIDSERFGRQILKSQKQKYPGARVKVAVLL